MDIIRPVFSDKNVAVRKCFLNISNNTLYHDEDHTRPLKAAEAEDACLKGLVIVAGDMTYIPIGYYHSGRKVIINYIEKNSTTPTSADIAKAESLEDENYRPS